MAEPLWTAGQIAAATGGAASGAFDVYGVAIDSREVNQGDLFVALKGDNQDGHDYLAAATGRGASGALVERGGAIPAGTAVVTVGDTLSGLTALGAASRDRLAGTVIGVTGSVGKTGTKTAIAAALARSGATYASERSFNNHIGVPLTLARTPAATRYAVLEMGMNHAGELSALTAIARPHVAVVTTIAEVHMEFFASLEAVADAKAEIFEGVQPGGAVVLNRENSQFERLAARATELGVSRIISFGAREDCDVRLIKARLHEDCSTATADVMGTLLTFKIGIPGDHWLSNSLAVLATVSAAEADLGLAGLALAEMQPPRGRGRRHRVDYRDGDILVVDESYNASPVAMLAAIKGLGQSVPGRRARRIAVLGDMRELGEQGPALHEALRQPLRDAGVDIVVAVGPLMQDMASGLGSSIQVFDSATAQDALQQVLDIVVPGDVVMVKGSNAIGLSRVVDALLAMQDRSALRRAAG
ncbi:UDP-N-acetylmuramoyl-tripeptide--D-alanyl-D-alanine ligase [Emcibacter sp. SYSU 3D8]|uniref:UDP-N-acetylmuramoyl-tripeptide--D-alanyl-D- alanine ligase n=1 Tax=Emcibacter sp. SYSU 3D8 TaxID=3133969 RepID=UPI0031FF2370